MAEWRKENRFDGRLVMLGFGSIGQGILPLLLRHIEMPPERIVVIKPHDHGLDVARELGACTLVTTLDKDNHRDVLQRHLGRGDFLLNLCVDVSSTALIELCQQIGALYLDTCIEPWEGDYLDTSKPLAERTNYALRESALALRRPGGDPGPTVVLTHGANPGLVSHFVKQALMNLAHDTAPQLVNGTAPGTPGVSADRALRLPSLRRRRAVAARAGRAQLAHPG